MTYMTALEVLVTIIFRNIIFEDSRKKYMNVMVPVAIILMILNKFVLSYMPNVAMISIISIITIFIWKLSGEKLIDVIIQIIITSIIMLFGELIALLLATLLNNWIVIKFEVYSIISVLIIWISMALLLEKIKIKGYLSAIYKIKNNRVSLNILINSMIVVILFKTLNDQGLLSSEIAIEISFYIILFIVLNFHLFMNIARELQEKNKLQLENNFKPMLDEYIHKLRANEHEYKNHINAIYSIIQVSNEHEIKENINNYIGDIKENNYLNNLLYVDNTILKAVLYSKMSLAEEMGIEIKHDIKSNLNGIPLDDMDLVVIISNLLNNAIEEVQGLEGQWINVDISERAKGKIKEYTIGVSNSISNGDQIKLDYITDKGASTKGEHRGYGLYNIKKLIKKVNGNMVIRIENDSINIEVVI